MTDLIEIKKVDGEVKVVKVILKNKDNDEVLDYALRNYSATMSYQDYGFDEPILGIGPEGCCFLDNSDKFFGRGSEGLVMICPNKEELEISGSPRLCLMYDDDELSEEPIIF